MTDVGQVERNTQDRVIQLFAGRLGYEYLGDWQDRVDNRNIEEKYLRAFLKKQGHKPVIIDKAVHELTKAAGVQTEDLYDINKAVYRMLRYGVSVRAGQGEKRQTIYFIDWKKTENNHFAVAEEVTVKGKHNKRPDVVLYVNGIAIGVIELKRSKVSVEEGIRQNLDNQTDHFIKSFFNTIQLVMAGNETAGLRYGTTETPEKYYLRWKETTDEEFEYILDKHLVQLCEKKRMLEILHDFILFDGGNKIVCRPHQYFGVKATQENTRKRENGIIWHTQGSGKSLTMVWIAQWIRENVTDSRVVVITDRTELDTQITRVFNDAEEPMQRATSGADLIDKLNSHEIPLISSLVHKFGTRDGEEMGNYLEDIEKHLPKNFKAKGELFVFVDECHRTQSGKLHKAMKAILPDAMFIGFTGTPLLKNDKKTSLEVFGPYIHTYKFDEAVDDNVVLDLRYEARDIDQRITDQESIDEWFDAETRGLNDLAKMELKKRWGTLKKVLSSKSRLEKVVQDVFKDFRVRPRLKSGQGNAMLVASSVAEACRYYELFKATDLNGHCAVVTSFQPNINDIKGEETGEGKTDEQLKYNTYMEMLDGKSTEEFEEEAKRKFVNEPARMKLLIVVDKLLTGFDAPPATYLYIDKSMQDHGLFQAICRVNRLDGEDKEYGYIVDYKDLFKSLEESINTYTSGAFEGYDSDDVKGLLKDRYEQAKERLDDCLDQVIALCEPIHPKTQKQFRAFFGCDFDGKTEEELKEDEEKRVSLYKMVSSLVRAYADIANEMDKAGYSEQEALDIKHQVKFYSDMKEEIKQASGDYIDLKSYEPGMRNLIDMYIDADHSRKISQLDDFTLVDLIVNKGVSALDDVLTENIQKDQEAVAETIENNIRKVIIEEKPGNPKYYEKMSELLEELIRKRKKEAADYEQYLQKLVELAKKVKRTEGQEKYPENVQSSGQKALYDNLNNDPEIALLVDETVKYTAKDGWRENKIKERQVMQAVKKKLPKEIEIGMVMEVVKNQNEY
ncbi:HsdR family type I site-specific deoxyribonuclease [Rhodohalobacter sp. SW132]|uniref:type I restriction endonuclease subunit R n=1 Tax=Rhodohalobacter sp. SW132 TaxID=2293433 RepID=UPI000E2590C5|nr:HsdR family type I site-specific deoxyribonuclease [Rhodohalobacter sp. SW132]REL32990.1 HsdR family type I site-specific deoxyribonuclease [Rhodohalobacter sp. SW132]